MAQNLFAERCFADQAYETNDTHWSYQDYAAGRLPPNDKNTGSHGLTRRPATSMKVLRRGRSTAVDQFLDWLVCTNFV
ncbi:hypothetical protein LTR66_002100 [Elasticomyces elasticus]|nr:hypothetical protein LTR50_005269 [Elasticomyces elasticus]KAK4998733.1 hypothetical protein LTR66_002100 [Elasticomyces elasticus]